MGEKCRNKKSKRDEGLEHHDSVTTQKVSPGCARPGEAEESKHKALTVSGEKHARLGALRCTVNQAEIISNLYASLRYHRAGRKTF